MKTQAIIPTAGSGERFKADLPKPLVELSGKPIFAYALEVFEKSSAIDSVILVGQKEKLSEFEDIVKQQGFKKVLKVIAGGKTRRESVSNGLAEIDDDAEIVLIHDGVRPFVSLEMIDSAVALSDQWDAVVTAVPVKSTIKRGNKESLIVEETVERDNLWEIQTPQVFKADVLRQAHQESQVSNPTDDAMMVETMGIKVKIAPGDYTNIKITTPEDLAIAEALLRSKNSSNKALL